MIYLLSLIPILAAILGLCYLLQMERRDRIEERKEWALERIGLLQRIQAPQVEVQKYQAEHDISEEPLYVSPEVDSEWDNYREDVLAGEAR